MAAMGARLEVLRRWLAILAIAVILAVGGTYWYSRYRLKKTITAITNRLGVEIQQSTTGFSFSKSEGGRTLFTIKASRAVQLGKDGRTQLKDVTIVVYGRDTNRFDRIYGSDFAYNSHTGDVSAEGPVEIDLESDNDAPQRVDQSPPEAKDRNPIHLKTSGLVFNQKTGIAQTRETIDFRLPQGTGSAKGAIYDSKQSTLILNSALQLATSDGQGPRTLNAEHGVITTQPRQAVLDGVKLQEPSRRFEADKVTLFLRPDNRVDHAVAAGNVRTIQTQTAARAQTVNRNSSLSCARAELTLSSQDTIRSAVLSGNVQIDISGEVEQHGVAGRVAMDFDDHNRLLKVRATDRVRLQQTAARTSGSHPGSPASGPGLNNRSLNRRPLSREPDARESNLRESMELTGDVVDFFRSNRSPGFLDQALASGQPRIVISKLQKSSSANKATAPADTSITADSLQASFDRGRQVRSLHGEAHVRIISSSPGVRDRISTSDKFDLVMKTEGSREVDSIAQHGNVQIEDGERLARAQNADYRISDETLVLTGAPFLIEGAITTTAQIISLKRRTGEIVSERDVKTTYSQMQPQKGGALLASSDPVHATARKMVAGNTSGTAVYSGEARLWQGANLVQAPTIEFERSRRRIRASGESSGEPQQVSCVFVEAGKGGKLNALNVRSNRLTYVDNERKAIFEGGVAVSSQEGTTTADHVEVLLYPSRNTSSSTGALNPPAPAGAGEANAGGTAAIRNPMATSQVQKITAEGRVVIQQTTAQQIIRKVTGEHLIYTPEEGKFVMTGTPREPPSIFDAEQGKVTGDTLTFYNRDDRVRVQGKEAGRTLTQTRVKK